MISMKRQLAAIALALASTAAFAQPLHLDAGAFTVDTESYYSPETILSDANGVTRIAMNRIDSDLKGWSSSYGDNGNYSWAAFSIGVRSGYQVTGYGLSGEFAGVITPGHDPQYPWYPGAGDALPTNRGMASMSAAAADRSQYYEGYTFNQAPLNGANSFAWTSKPTHIVTDFNIEVEGMVTMNAPDFLYYTANGREEHIQSFASMELKNVVLTLYTAPIASPVPEPETYAMLLAGLAAIGFASRRRKRALGENQS